MKLRGETPAELAGSARCARCEQASDTNGMRTVAVPVVMDPTVLIYRPHRR